MMMMMFSMLVSGYLTIALVDGKPKEFFFSPFFRAKKQSTIKVIDILCGDCSGTIILRMCSYFVSFFTDQYVLQATKGCVQPLLFIPQ